MGKLLEICPWVASRVAQKFPETPPHKMRLKRQSPVSFFRWEPRHDSRAALHFSQLQEHVDRPCSCAF